MYHKGDLAGHCPIYISYKNDSRLNHYNFGKVNAVDFPIFNTSYYTISIR